MRVTFVLAAFDLAGGERVISVYAQELLRRGHEVFAISSGRPRLSFLQRIKAVLRGRRLARPAPRAYHFAATDVPHRELSTRRPIRETDVPDADVIVATWWETANWVEALPPSKGKKVHFIQHYEAFTANTKGEVDRVLALPMPKIVIATWLKDLLEERGVEDIALIPNAIDTRQFFAPPRGKQKVPTIGILYHNIGWKGTDVGLRAIDIVRKSIPNLRIIAFGPVAVDPALPLPAGSDYFQRPDQQQLRTIYAGADVWMSPSFSEGFGLPTFEAMACRTPAVATRTGGAADFIVSGKNGYLSDPGDAESLARHLETVLRLDESQWRRMSDAALETIARYTLDDSVDLFEQALAQVISGESVVTASHIYKRPGAELRRVEQS